MRTIVFLFLIACMYIPLSAQEKTVVLDSTNVAELEGSEEWDRFIRSWKAVPLRMDSTNEVDLSGVFMFDDYVVVQGDRDGKECLMLYDMEGNFLHQIGRQGIGKGEYGYVNFVRLDQEKREIEVFDAMTKGRGMTYDFEGNFKRETPCKRVLQYVREVHPIEGDKYVGCFICSPMEVCHFVCDRDYRNIKALRPHYATFPMGMVNFSNHPIARCQDRITLLTPLCDTLFEYRNGSLHPRFITNVHRSVSDDFKPYAKDYLSSLHQMKKQGFYAKDDIFETGKWFMISYATGKLFYEKKKGKAYFMPVTDELRGDLIYPTDLWGQRGEQLIAVYTADEMMAVKAKMEKAGVKISSRLAALFQDAAGGKNPWMIFYRLK